MKIFVKFSLVVAIVIGAVLMIGDKAGAQAAPTNLGNTYPNAAIVPSGVGVNPVRGIQPNQINNNLFNNKPFFLLPNFFNPFFNPFLFNPFLGVGLNPLLIP